MLERFFSNRDLPGESIDAYLCDMDDDPCEDVLQDPTHVAFIVHRATVDDPSAGLKAVYRGRLPPFPARRVGNEHRAFLQYTTGEEARRKM